MSRTVQPCRVCWDRAPSSGSPFAPPRGMTRHDDGVCAACRREQAARRARVLTPSRSRVVLMPANENPAAPTVAQVAAGVDLTPHLLDAMSWHGTDCPCLTCARDRTPGRYA